MSQSIRGAPGRLPPASGPQNSEFQNFKTSFKKNVLIDYLKNNYDIKNLKENYIKILICFAPVIPHFANECLAELGHKEKMEWPPYNEALIEDEKTNIVIQINGKKRAMIEVKTNEKEEKIIKECLQITNVKKFIDDKVILKKIYIKNKLVNLVVK